MACAPPEDCPRTHCGCIRRGNLGASRASHNYVPSADPPNDRLSWSYYRFFWISATVCYFRLEGVRDAGRVISTHFAIPRPHCFLMVLLDRLGRSALCAAVLPSECGFAVGPRPCGV